MIVRISIKNILFRPFNALLSILLMAFGVASVSLILSGSKQLESAFSDGSKKIDLVVGAKGSPLQLILCNVFHIDFPTGNISLKEASLLAKNRMVAQAIPLSLGDSYQGFRIVGTNSDFLTHYGVTLASGNAALSPRQVVIGSNVAAQLNLSIGSTFSSTHGMVTDGSQHDEHQMIVTGIAQPTGTVLDDLIICDLRTVWQAHSHHEQEVDTTRQITIFKTSLTEAELENLEITSLLLTYASPMAAIQLPRLVNSSTNMQAASPAFEQARLFTLLEKGIRVLVGFGWFIIGMSAFSIMLALLNSLKERSYELAIIRCMGGSRWQVFLLVFLEGMLVTTLGSLIGIGVSHVLLEFAGNYYGLPSISGFELITEEMYVLVASFAIGLVASILPAWHVTKSSVSEILSKR